MKTFPDKKVYICRLFQIKITWINCGLFQVKGEKYKSNGATENGARVGSALQVSILNFV